jgi:filamentous hemagglutinin family protein
MSISWLAKADNLPSGGNIVSGSAEITTSGNTMNITQSSDKVVAHWQDFSIGHGNEVNFIQPSQSSVALNKVLGSNVSLIQGALNANGRVFLINPNGITFSSQAQVNVGGLVASTQNISTEDFLASQYNFDGHSSSAIINQGNITASDTGTIALIAAKVINNGTIEAHRGNVIFGSGNKLTLDLGGPVKLEVHEGTIDGLIEQGGAVRADGGLIYLSAKSLSELTSSVINHTGVTEAKTLSTGENGQIMLMGDMDYGITKVSGHINASAPDGGNGGFIETSAARVKVTDDARVTTLSTHGESGLWLIDPIDFTVAASGGDMTGAAVESALAGGKHTVETSNPGGNIYINDAVSWSTNMLILKAHNNIIINSNLVATGSASLEFKYGQDSSSGGTSTYTIADGVDVLIPNAEAFTWQKGTSGPPNNLTFGNQYITFENSQGGPVGGPAIDSRTGALTQPWFYNNDVGRFQKLTYNRRPGDIPLSLDYAVGTDGDGSGDWNFNGEIFNTQGSYAVTSNTEYKEVETSKLDMSLNIAKYQEGIGEITVKTIFDPKQTTSGNLELTHNYHIEQDKKFVRIKTTVKNDSAREPLTNVRLWVGTHDDFLAGSDKSVKTKGNIINSFEPISDQNTLSNSIKVNQYDDFDQGAAVLFFSTSDKADSVTAGYGGNNSWFDKIIEKDPRTSPIQTPVTDDGSYGLYLRMDDLPATTSETLTWYYAADAAITIDQVIDDIVIDVEQESRGYTPAPAPTPVPTPAPAPTPITTDIPETTAISDAQSIITIVNNTFSPPLTYDFSKNFGSSSIFQVGAPSIITSEATQVKSNQQNLATGSEQKLVIGNEQNLATGSEQSLVIGNEQNLATGSEQSLVIGNEQNLATGSEQSLVIGNEQNFATGSEQSLIIGNEQNFATGSEQSLVIGNEQNLATGSEQNLVIGNEQNLATGSEQGLVIGNEQNLATGSEQGLVIGNEQNLATGSEQGLIIGNKQNLATSSEQGQAIGNEQNLTTGNEQSQAIGNEQNLAMDGEQSQEQDKQQSESVAELYGKVDITGPLKVFVIDGGIRIPTWASEKNQDSN